MAELAVSDTPIPGLLVVDLVVYGDNRGWFKENWQRAKMMGLGLPDFGPVQNNVSFNAAVGATRGIHAEPWDKYVSVAAGKIFGAWVDLRAGDSFGTVFTTELGPERAVFVPRGVGNAFQTLADQTVYSYLVNDHWSAEAKDSYTFVNLADLTLAIDWPIALERAELSEADRRHPALADVTPARRPTTLVLGGGGQVGRAVAAALPTAEVFDRSMIDITDPDSLAALDWRRYDTVINAAAYTAVDQAETPEGRRAAWAANVAGVSRLAAIAEERRLTLVHLSSDYVFDGTMSEHVEEEPVSPLGVYGQTKAAGDVAAALCRRHYILRTSWVVGAGKNFVRTMADLAGRGISPSVIEDQFGRLSFADEIARAIQHLLKVRPPYGIYNLSGAGPAVSWAQIARRIFAECGRDPADVAAVSTAAYSAGKQLAPRPRHSMLVLDKIEQTGFVPRAMDEQLIDYLRSDR